MMGYSGMPLEDEEPLLPHYVLARSRGDAAESARLEAKMLTEKIRRLRDATIPTKPAAYWRPHASLTEVYYLRHDGSWRLSPAGKDIDPDDVPSDLVFLGDYMSDKKTVARTDEVDEGDEYA